MDNDKLDILKIFKKNVLGRTPDVRKANAGHDGAYGHWLEEQMGLKKNGKNEPDINGYEMKNHTRAKTTFGDWSGSYYIFKDKDFPCIPNRNAFIDIFGKPNADKNYRMSWSGEPIPKINEWNTFGCILRVDDSNNILIAYDFSKDSRGDKDVKVPQELRQGEFVLVRWDRESISKKLEKKFNSKGWFKCEMQDGAYASIAFGPPLSFDSWIAMVKRGEVYFDSGMYATNKRPYSQWRANNGAWDNMITERYFREQLAELGV